jgi:hypothetical protein
MSEHGQSVHVRGADSAAIITISRRSGVPGRFIANNDYWGTFVPWEDFAEEAFVRHAPGQALIWEYSEHSSLAITLWEGGQASASIEIVWGRPVDEAQARLFERLAIPNAVGAFERLCRLAAHVETTGPKPRDVRNSAATALRLPAYEWLSPAYCRDTGLDDLRIDFPSAHDID